MKFRIIHQLSLVGIGGVQQSFVKAFKDLSESTEFNHYVFSNNDIDQNFYKIDKKFYRVRFINFNFLLFLFHLRSKKSIVHFYNNLGSKKIYWLLRIFGGNRIIFHERGTSWNSSRSQTKYYSFNFKTASTVVTNSYASKQMLAQKFNLDEKKMVVIHNGVLNNSDLSKRVEDQPLNGSNSFFTVGFIGRLEDHKGIYTVLAVARLLPHVSFLIAGAGPWQQRCKAAAAEHSNIKFVGRVNDPYEFMKQISVLLVPSIREPLGNVIIEAGSAGKAVIASAVDGIPEIIEHDKSGILISPSESLKKIHSIQAGLGFPEYIYEPTLNSLQTPKILEPRKVANQIERLKNDSTLMYSLGQQLRLTCTQKFSIDNYRLKIDSVYRHVARS